MRLSIQRLRWVLVAGALLLVTVLAFYIGYGHYRAISAYRRILARSGVTISRDTNGVTWSQSSGKKKIFTLRTARETSLGNGKFMLHDADLLLYTRDPDRPDHIYGKQFEYDQNQGVARALGEVFMDLQAPEALAGTHHAAAAGKGQTAASAAAAQKPAQGHVIHVRTSGLVYQRKIGVASTDQQVEFQYGGIQCTAVGAELNTSQNVLRLLSHVTMDGLTHRQPIHLTAIRADMDRTANIVNLTQTVVLSEDRKASADKAVLDLRKDGSIEQVHGLGDVVLSSGTQVVTSERLDATLSPESVPETARLLGNVLLTDSSTERSMRGIARQVDAVFNAQGAPESVVATGAANLSMVDHTNQATGVHGLERQIQGQRIVALFVPGMRKSSSRLNELHSTGAASVMGESLASPAKSSTPLKTPVPKALQHPTMQFKTLRVAADDLRILFIAGDQNKPQPERLYGTGHTLLRQDGPLDEQEVSHGDTLEATFSSAAGAQGSSSPVETQVRGQQLTILSAVQAGHVTIYDRAATRTTAATQSQLLGRMGSVPGAVASGGSEISTGSAQRALYDGTTQRVTLLGQTQLANGNVSLRAPTVVLDQQTGDAEAHGGVQTTIENASADLVPDMVQGSSESAERANAAASAETKPTPTPVTHVLSASATFDHARKLSEFRGSDAEPARMWQNASQVQAAILLLDGAQHTFSARPASAGALVHAVFAGAPASAKPGSGQTTPDAGRLEAARPPAESSFSAQRSSRAGHSLAPHSSAHQGDAEDYVRVASPKMDYNDLQREATFAGSVQIDGTLGEVSGERAAVFLAPAARSAAQGSAASRTATSQNPVQRNQTQPSPLSGSVDRVIISGDVRMEQPGRRGTGEQLLYTAGADSYVLTGSPGHPPHIVDAQQGNVTGTTLLFGAAGSTIVVAGGPGAPKTARGRVRTETEVRQ